MAEQLWMSMFQDQKLIRLSEILARSHNQAIKYEGKYISFLARIFLQFVVFFLIIIRTVEYYKEYCIFFLIPVQIFINIL